MRLVCSYCRKVIRHDAGTRVCDVSHGMCLSCASHFDKLWNGMSLAEYLDTLPAPVVVVDGDGRVIGASARLGALLDRDRSELPGLTCGEAFACVRSRLPEGCGRTVHCRDCAIRRAVTRVHEKGKPLRNVLAWVETVEGRVKLRLSASAEQGLVKVVVKELKPAPRAEETD